MEEEARRKQLLEQSKQTDESGIESEALDAKQNSDGYASNIKEEEVRSEG